MKRIVIGGLALLVLAGIIASGWVVPDAKWSGVDESVVGKFAKEAGRPAAEPYLNTDQGDLKLFVFLVAGVLGGFIAGYQFHRLFSPKPGQADGSSQVRSAFVNGITTRSDL